MTLCGDLRRCHKRALHSISYALQHKTCCPAYPVLQVAATPPAPLTWREDEALGRGTERSCFGSIPHALSRRGSCWRCRPMIRTSTKDYRCRTVQNKLEARRSSCRPTSVNPPDTPCTSATSKAHKKSSDCSRGHTVSHGELEARTITARCQPTGQDRQHTSAKRAWQSHSGGTQTSMQAMQGVLAEHTHMADACMQQDAHSMITTVTYSRHRPTHRAQRRHAGMDAPLPAY